VLSILGVGDTLAVGAPLEDGKEGALLAAAGATDGIAGAEGSGAEAEVSVGAPASGLGALVERERSRRG